MHAQPTPHAQPTTHTQPTRTPSPPCTPSASTPSAPPKTSSTRRHPPPPQPPGQVRIKVAAAGVHLLDTAIREGIQGPLPQLPPLPTTPGREVAGTVDGLGEGVDPAWLGKRVVAHIGFAPGGYAEQTVTEASRLHELPAELDFAQAVALIGTGRTTMGILRFAEPDPDSVVIIPAAAGGIGTLLTQYAKHRGATVIGLAGGPRKTARVRANGADLAVDYTDPAWPDEVRAYLKESLDGRPTTIVFERRGRRGGPGRGRPPRARRPPRRLRLVGQGPARR